MKKLIFKILFIISLTDCFAGQIQLDPNGQNISFRHINDPRLSRYDHMTEIRVGEAPHSFTILELLHERYSAEEIEHFEALVERARTEGKIIQIDYDGDFETPIISSFNLVERRTANRPQIDQLSECQNNVESFENLLSRSATNTAHVEQLSIDLNSLSSEMEP
jgi:hypothetical protein